MSVCGVGGGVGWGAGRDGQARRVGLGGGGSVAGRAVG